MLPPWKRTVSTALAQPRQRLATSPPMPSRPAHRATRRRLPTRPCRRSTRSASRWRAPLAAVSRSAWTTATRMRPQSRLRRPRLRRYPPWRRTALTRSSRRKGTGHLLAQNSHRAAPQAGARRLEAVVCRRQGRHRLAAAAAMVTGISRPESAWVARLRTLVALGATLVACVEAPYVATLDRRRALAVPLLPCTAVAAAAAAVAGLLQLQLAAVPSRGSRAGAAATLAP